MQAPPVAGLFLGFCWCGTGFSRRLPAPSPADAGDGWGGVSSGIAANRASPLPASSCLRKGRGQELAAEAAPAKARSALAGQAVRGGGLAVVADALLQARRQVGQVARGAGVEGEGLHGARGAGPGAGWIGRAHV